MLQHYIEHLTLAIRQHPAIRKNAQLKGSKWTKSGYATAADIISDGLDELFNPDEKQRYGATISAKTLSNMFQGAYRITFPIDPRSLNTLNKLARFIGYSGWDAFTEQTDATQATDDDPTKAAEKALREAILLEFKAYTQLPQFPPEHMPGKRFISDSPAHRRVLDNLSHYQAAGLHISNPYNPSTVDVLELEFQGIQDGKARYRTQEYWLLCWWDEGIKRYARRHKAIEPHYYTLIATEEGWKVYSNSTLADITESGGLT
jgi:hypothetical protein